MASYLKIIEKYDSMRTNDLGFSISKRPVIYYILNFTWGLFTTLLGYLLLLILLPFGKVKRFHYTLYLEFHKDIHAGFSIGTVFFVRKNASEGMIIHEFGHTLQNAMFGPLTLLLIYLPSVIRFWYRELYTKITSKHPKKDYYEIWFEYQATLIGTRFDRYKFQLELDKAIKFRKKL